MADLAAIVKATRASAAALKRAHAWNRAAIQAEREMDAADRARNIPSAEAAHSRHQQALRLVDANMRRHETAQAFLAANPLPGDRTVDLSQLGDARDALFAELDAADAADRHAARALRRV